MNPYKLLKDILPDPRLEVGEVVAIADGIATIELPGGGTVQGRGDATIGQQVFVRDGVIEGDAPSLPVELIEV